MPNLVFSTRYTLKLVTLALLASGVSVAAQAAPKIVASIKPIHSLVAGVMDGVGEPELIVEGAGSPHAYAMRPTQAAMLQDADLVFWVGPILETFLARPIETLGAGASVPLMEAALESHGDGGAHAGHEESEKHGADRHAHEGEAGASSGEHAHEAAGHAHENEHEHEHEHGTEAEAAHGHSHEGGDPHVWLNPDEAASMVHRIEEALSKADPENAATYAANAEALELRLAALEGEIETEIEPVKDAHFVVFHDAYTHFSERFGITPDASVTVSPDRTPSAAHVAEVRETIERTKATCVFAEPQFEPKLVDVLIEGTSARAGTLDPLGATLADGPDLYFELMRNLATSLKDCLSAQS
ncbi:zinc ABC transporter substrate-binding protein [Fulvimarina sp. 2208YS6-2-32]|uniref:High-affinity zinc uptake system protein ZnuA n=1 Tax=Fulvimarina uroteuthidis TaxID=3098149 RepID=A0ABU5HXU9_9HYPH|nr:zinc ABC transporter substrate-binding protein [Fulvimarina sp. 2208YS6-2-32]MDY8107598.1 zinc ABC transporter substrate-binding protein [Fulvimarina sp. 2208YS6-2-32]